MADFRPFRALRFDPAVAGDMGGVLAPPYDVIDAEEQASLHRRSPHNVVRLELAEERSDDTPASNRYTRAASLLSEWRREGVLRLDDRAAFYVYRHQFAHEGHRYTRTSLFGRVRLEPWEAGVVRPHEQTMAAPKEDRLQLLRHLRAQVSPVFGLYRDTSGTINEAIPSATRLFDATTLDQQRHSLALLSDQGAVASISAVLRDVPIYIADGHHRYETALAYRDEARAAASSWTGEEPENFVLMALTAIDDPGLVMLPIHRLVRPPSLPGDLVARLERLFDVQDTTPKSYDGTALLRLLARLSAEGASRTAIGALGLEEGRFHLLLLRDTAAVRRLMPARSTAWQSLDVNVAEYAVLRGALGVVEGAGALDYTEDAQRALRAIEAGRWQVALLLNRTPVEQVLAVADAGERMPAKATFFYPKLATGLTLYSFE
jgi:uncharacterized protein (DUF1015 family)